MIVCARARACACACVRVRACVRACAVAGALLALQAAASSAAARGQAGAAGTTAPAASAGTPAASPASAAAVPGGAIERLRATLSGLQGQEPLKGTLQISEWNHDTKNKNPREYTGKLQAHFEAGKESLSLRVTSPVLAKARAEALLAEEAPRPTRGLLGSVSLVELDGLLGAAAGLATDLRDADLVEERADASRGKPGRLLRLKLKPPSDAPSQIKVEAERALRVWLDDEGTPLASEETSRIEAGLLFLKGKGQGRIERRYQKVGTRLVVTDETREQSYEGLGQEGASKRVLHLTLSGPPAP